MCVMVFAITMKKNLCMICRSSFNSPSQGEEKNIACFFLYNSICQFFGSCCCISTLTKLQKSTEFVPVGGICTYLSN